MNTEIQAAAVKICGIPDSPHPAVVEVIERMIHFGDITAREVILAALSNSDYIPWAECITSLLQQGN